LTFRGGGERLGLFRRGLAAAQEGWNVRRILVLAAIVVLAPGLAWAQNSGLSTVLLRFFDPSNPFVLATTGHQAHFSSQPAAQEALRQLNRGIATQLSTFPLSSASGGFTYTFDKTLGVFTRSSESFGPLFSERALTAGKGKLNFGFNYSRATYDTFEGNSLRNGDLKLFLTHSDINGDGDHLNFYFEGDVIRTDLYLNITSENSVFFANYGVSDRFDVGLTVPYVHVKIDARIHATVDALSTGGDSFVSHVFPNQSDEADFKQGGTAQGIGDVVLRAKYHAVRGDSWGLAAAADLRVPTGDENDLLGSGATQLKLYAIASGTGKFSPHVNVGYTFSKGGSEATGALPAEFNYTAGFDAALGHRVTLTGDLIGRILRKTGRIQEIQQEWNYMRRNDPNLHSTALPELVEVEGDLNVVLASAGLRVNPFKNLLISANALFSTGKRGLQDHFTPVIAFDYSF
jgi:hypothetical protein